MAKAVGVGGIFLKAKDPKALSEWYGKHFSIQGVGGGSLMFEGPESMGTTVLAHFAQDTKHFGDGPQQSMLNLRVDDLDALLIELAEAGVRIDPKRDSASYGKFGWIWDPEGNRVELWEPAIEDEPADGKTA